MNRKNEVAMFAKNKKRYAPFQEAKANYRKIAGEQNIKTADDAIKHLKSGKLPKDIPRNPEKVYSKENIEKNIRAGIDVKKDVYF